jgi:hypothetical protein
MHLSLTGIERQLAFQTEPHNRADRETVGPASPGARPIGQVRSRQTRQIRLRLPHNALMPHYCCLPYPPSRLPRVRGQRSRVAAERRAYLDDLAQGAGVV